MANKCEEVIIVSVSKAASLGNSGFIVESFQFSDAYQMESVSNQAIAPRTFQAGKTNESKDAAG